MTHDHHDGSGIAIQLLNSGLHARPWTDATLLAAADVASQLAESPLAACADPDEPVDAAAVLMAAERVARARAAGVSSPALDLIAWLALLDVALAVYEVPRDRLHGPDDEGSYRVDTAVDEAADDWLMEGDVVVAVDGDRSLVMVVGEADHEHPDRLGGLLLPMASPLSVADVVVRARRERG